MVIQRIQSLYLLLASAFMALFTFLPLAIFPDQTSVSPSCYPVYLVLNLTTAVLMFIDIFLFKNLRQQITIAKVIVMLVLGSAVCGAVTIVYGSTPTNANVQWYSVLLLCAAFIFTLLAIKNMNRDYRKLKSYDSLR